MKFRILQLILFGFCLMCVGTLIGLNLNLKCSSVTENSYYKVPRWRTNETMAIDSDLNTNFIRDGKIDSINSQNTSKDNDGNAGGGGGGVHRIIIDSNGFSITTTTAAKSEWDSVKRNQSNDSFDDLQALVVASLNATQNDKYVNIIVASSRKSKSSVVSSSSSSSTNDDDIDKNNNELHLNIGKGTEPLNSLEQFHRQITQFHMYSEKNANIIDAVLTDMAMQRIERVVQMDGGTQLKLIITYSNGMKAVFKPMRFSREYQTPPNHFYFNDFERHTSEIAAFHLDRVLGLRRAVPGTKRKIIAILMKSFCFLI